MSASSPAKYWFLPLLAGALYVALGVWVLRTPLESYLALTFLFSLSFLVSGVVEIFGAFSERGTRAHWGWALAGGIFDLLLGVMLFNNPGMSVAVLPFVVGFGLLLRSSTTVAGAFALKSAGGQSWGMLMVFGVLGVVAGFVLLRNPLLAGFTIVVWTGIRVHHGGLARVMAALALRKGEDAMA